MGQSKDEKRAAIQAHKDARRELERVSKRDRYESDDFLDANRRVIETEKNVPWWRR